MSLSRRLAAALLAPRSLNRDRTLLAAERLSAATHLVASLELLARSRDRQAGGPNDWSVSRRNIARRGRFARTFFDAAAQPGVNTALHLARAASAAFLVAPTGRYPRARLAANVVATGASLSTFPSQIYGTDGSDQASFLVQATAAVARSSRRPEVVDAALWFLALQSTLNYAASGWVKMTSRTWRSGDALPGVMRTVTYGHRGAWQTTQRFPRSSRTLAHAVLAMECLFPAVFAAGGRLAPTFTASAAAFHAANAGLMGLGRFVGAFCAMHPAVLYVTDPRRRTPSATDGPPRSDVLPAAAATAAVGALAAGAVARARRRRTIMRGRPGERHHITRSGNSVSYLTAGLELDGPIVFLESALAATDQHWEWVRRSLTGRLPTVVYQRAGYGTSEYRAARPFALTHAVADFVDLVDHVAGDRPAVVVGHALGGYLAMRSAARLGARARGVVLVNSSHPQELLRSPRQAAGAQMLDSSLQLMAPSMRLGLGPLLQTPRALDRLPADARHAAEIQYRDDRLWSAAHREWQATRAAFAAFDGDLPTVEAPILVLTAAHTVEDDPVQAQLHQELGACGTGVVHHTIDGADHDTIITDRECAARVADHIAEFVGKPQRSLS